MTLPTPDVESVFPAEIWDGTTPNRVRRDDKRPVSGEDWWTLIAELRSSQVVITQIGALASANWLESVKSCYDPTPNLPVAPDVLDRYLACATANGWTDGNIYEWNGSVWVEQIPIEGSAVWIDDENKIYMYQDGVWVKLAATIGHGSLLSLGSDDHLQYVHKDVPRTITAKHTFDPAAPAAPFDLGANAQGQVVTGLNADQLDGQHASAFEAAGAVATHEGAFVHGNIHVKGADLGLDAGGANPITAATLASHVASTSNPHSVTKAQVGLSNLSDDAQLKIASNLSDVANATTARGNIGAASTTHKDTHKSGGSDAFISTDLIEAVVKRLQVSGPVDLLIGAVADGQFLKRSGSSVIGGAVALTTFGGEVGFGATYADIAAFIVAADASGADRYEIYCVGNTVIVSIDTVFKKPTDWYGVGDSAGIEKTVLSLFSGRILLNQTGDLVTSLHRFYNLNIAKTSQAGQITIQDEQGQVEFHNCHLSAQSPVTPNPMVLFDAATQEAEAYPSVKLFNCGFKTSTNAKYLIGTSAAGNGHRVRVEVHNCYPLSGGATTSILLSMKGAGTVPVCNLFMTGGSRFSFLAFEGQVSPAPQVFAHVDAISFLAENKMVMDIGGSFFVTEYGGDRIRENSGPTQLSVTGIADGEFLKRSGTNIIGDTPPVAAHTIASHSDTTATGAELETLTNNSNADALHVHADESNPTNSTGWLNGGILSIGTGIDDFTISDGDIQFVTAAGVKTLFSTSGPSYVDVAIPAIGASLITFVGVNAAGTIIQQATPFTNIQTRTIAVCGVVVHVDGINVDAINVEQHVAYNAVSQLYDLADSIGFFNDNGNVFSANASALDIKKSIGAMFKAGSNVDTSVDDPHVKALAALAPATFQYRFSNGDNGATGTAIDPGNLDNGAGGLTAVANNRWSVQRIYSFISNNVKVQRGVADYPTLDAAVNAIQTEAYIPEPSIEANGLLRGWLIVKKGATDLSNAATALFLEAPKFPGGSSAGGASITDLQAAYQNSTPNPEILTDAINGPVTVRRGSAADTDKILETQNGAAAEKFSVRGDGVVRNAGQVRWSKGADIPSVAALALGVDGNEFDVTGTTAITSIATQAVGTMVLLHFDGILTLTHHAANLILPSGANIATAAGDIAVFYEYDTGLWRCSSYARANGTALVGSAVPPQRLHLEAATFDNPVTGHLITLPAPIAESPVNAGLKTRQFNQTEKGVSWKDRIPAGATTMKLRLMSNVTVQPAAVRTVGLKLYYRKITDGVAVALWNGANDGDEVLDDIDIAVGILPLEDEQTLTLGSLTPVIPADEMYQFELTRINPQAGTEYPDTDGVWELQSLEVEFA